MTTMTTRPAHHKQSFEHISTDSTVKDIVPIVVADVYLWIGLSKASGTDHIVTLGILDKETRIGILETLPVDFTDTRSALPAH